MGKDPSTSSVRGASGIAPQSSTYPWGADFLRLVETEADARLGRRIVVVPDGITADWLQHLCMFQDRVSRRCITARYVIPRSPAIGTMVASFVSDVEFVRNWDRETLGEWSRETMAKWDRETLGDLSDQDRGYTWASFASRLGSSDLSSRIINDRLPRALATGRFDLSTSRELFALIGHGADTNTGISGALAEDECLVLLLDTGDAIPDLVDIAAKLPRGILLVVTIPPEQELDSITKLIGPVMRLPRYKGPPPRFGRITYADSALAADQPADVDALGMTGLAITTAKLLMHEATGPICIGVEAPWGKGKSSFLRLVRRQAEQQAAYDLEAFQLLPVDFNAWVYNNAEQAWAGLAAEVITAIETRLSRWQRTELRWSYAWHHRRGLLSGSLAAGAVAIGLSVLVVALNRGEIAQGRVDNPLALILTAVSPTLVGLILLAGTALRVTRPVSQRVHEYLARPDHAVRRGYQNEVVSDLRFTLAALRRRRPDARVVVMVDDLDRCGEDKVVEILQAINVVLAQSNVYTLLAIDGDMVRRAVYRHYRGPAEETLPSDYQLNEDFPHKYLEKIVQFSIQLPSTSDTARSAYARSLFTVPAPAEPETTIGASPHPDVKRQVKQGFAIDMSQVAPPTVGEIFDLPTADTEAEADAMASYQGLLEDNPREIKRAVNVHRFVKIALYRGARQPSPEIQRRLVLWVILCLVEPTAVSSLLRSDDLALAHDDLLSLIAEPFQRRGMTTIPDKLPSSDLPLLVSAANLIQLVGLPGRTRARSPE